MRFTPDQQVSNYVDLETQHLHIKITRHCHASKLAVDVSFRFGSAQPFLLGPEKYKKNFNCFFIKTNIYLTLLDTKMSEKISPPPKKINISERVYFMNI